MSEAGSSPGGGGSKIIIFDEPTIRFFRIPETACEFLNEEEQENDQDNNNNDDTKSQRSHASNNNQPPPPRAKIIGSLKKNLDIISLVACRRQGVLPAELHLKQSFKKMSWADKQHRLGLLRVLALERSRVATEIANVLESEQQDPHARLRMEQEIKLTQKEVAGALYVADPDEQDMINRLLSANESHASTVAIQTRLITAVRRRSEKAVARMYRQHERVMVNEQENHKNRVDLVRHLQERESVRDQMQAEKKKELHEKVVQQSEIREKKMSALRIRFAVINEAKKQELEEKIKHSEELYENAQQRQIEHLIERSEKQHNKIISVQEQVARSRREEMEKRIQLDEERRQRQMVHEERREEILMKKDLRIERKRQCEEMLQIRAREHREKEDERLRKEFEAAHTAATNAAAVATTPKNQSRPASKQRSTRPSTSDSAAAAAATSPTPTATATIDRRKAEREEMLRRQLMIQIQEEHNTKVLEDRRIEAEAARRVRQREEEAKFEHNRENLKRKERADQHRHQLQKVLVEEAERAAREREHERIKAERKLQLLKLDLQKQREEAQDRLREQEKIAHLKQSGSSRHNSRSPERSENHHESPTPNKSARAAVPPPSSSKPTPQNSAIMAVIAGGKSKK
jgi:hypothetical protein